MATKRKPAKKRDPNQITAAGKPDEDQAVAIARTVLRPTVQAAVTLKEYGKSYGDLDLGGLIDSLIEQTRASSDGDLKRAEAMLTAQAHTLDAIFNNLARRAALNMGEYMDACEKLPEARPARAVTVPGDLGGAGDHQEPAGGRLCQAGQHRSRPAAGEQRNGCARWRPARGRKSESAKQTNGGKRWRTAGLRNGVHARPS